MAHQLIGPFVVFGCVVLAIVVAQAFAARTAHLQLGLFRPYRGDGWPIGVQEDDDFRFNWSPKAASAPAASATVIPDLPWDEIDIVDAPTSVVVEMARVDRVRIGPPTTNDRS